MARPDALTRRTFLERAAGGVLTEATRHTILVDNPARLYEFAEV